MIRDLLPFPTKLAKPRGATLATLGLLRELAERLPLAAQFVSEVRKRSAQGGVPKLFFFHATSDKPKQRFDDSMDAIQVARRHPELAEAWATLRGLIDEAFTLAATHVEVRHMARAVPQLQQSLAVLGKHHQACHHFSRLLEIVDDEVITVLVPEERTGWRVLVRGLVNLGQFHLLLADRVDSLEIDGNTATIRWQFHLPSNRQADGTLPKGFQGHEHWLWEKQSLRKIPLVNGERLLLAGPPAYPRQWIVTRPFAAVIGEIEVLPAISEMTLRKAA